MPNSRCVKLTVIVSAAKQSRGRSTRPLDCFVARAPRNDGHGGVCVPNSTFLFLGLTLVRGVSRARKRFSLSGLRTLGANDGSKRWQDEHLKLVVRPERPFLL